MPRREVTSFPDEVRTELKYYVYRLIDPRNGETFYVGKGKDNRVFQHAANELDKKEIASDELSEKRRRIREINLDNFKVQHVIHRHGMDEKTAIEVEAALIDAYPSVTNIAGGHYSNERGVAHADQIIVRYKAEPADITKHRLVGIIINRSAFDTSVYDATRFCWRMGIQRARKAEYVVAILNGLIVGVFKPEEWLKATPENFPEFRLEKEVEGRIGFKGELAPKEIQNFYLQKRTPKSGKGAANPIRYWNI